MGAWLMSGRAVAPAPPGWRVPWRRWRFAPQLFWVVYLLASRNCSYPRLRPQHGAAARCARRCRAPDAEARGTALHGVRCPVSGWMRRVVLQEALSGGLGEGTADRTRAAPLQLGHLQAACMQRVVGCGHGMRCCAALRLSRHRDARRGVLLRLEASVVFGMPCASCWCLYARQARSRSRLRSADRPGACHAAPAPRHCGIWTWRALRRRGRYARGAERRGRGAGPACRRNELRWP